eukprot:gene1948-2384_t
MDSSTTTTTTSTTPINQKKKGGGGGPKGKFNNATGVRFNSISMLPTTSVHHKHYIGLYTGYGVKILDYDQGVDLYSHGCFGKGNLSRSVPLFDNIKNSTTGSTEPTKIEINNKQKQQQDHDDVNANNKKILYKMTIDECWNVFSKEEPNFLANYIGYHYFRSIGWVPKSGIKYGCDFVLYKMKPDLIHAQYGVAIQYYKNNSKRTNNNNNSDNNNNNNNETQIVAESLLNKVKGIRELTTWDDLCGLNRVSESVAKK